MPLKKLSHGKELAKLEYAIASHLKLSLTHSLTDRGNCKEMLLHLNKLASLGATLVRNYNSLTH